MSGNEKSAEELNDKMARAVMPVTIFVGVEVVVAFVGNLVVLYVFLFRYPKSNFRYFVLCLTLIDITCALTTMPGEMLTQTHWYVYPYPIICKIKSFFNVFTVSSEALCFLTIAVDRYRKVCHPLGWQIKLPYAKWLCLAIYTAGFAIAFPVAIYWGTHTEIENGNITTTVCEKDQVYKDTKKPIEYSLSIESLLGVLLAIMLLLYILIARAVMSQNNRHRKYTKAQTEFTNHANNNNTENNDGFSRNTGVSASSDSAEPQISDSPTQDSRVSTISDSVDPQTSDSQGRESGMSTTSNSSVPSRRNRGGDSHRNAHTLDPRAFNHRVRRKTLIMFILTITFIVTTIVYLTMLSFIAKNILRDLSDVHRAVYFFFFRFYFINHVINPIVYGVLDPHFRTVVRAWWNKKHRQST